MKNRRGFLAALTVASGAAVLPLAVNAAPEHQPSADALAFAVTCRAFDPALTDAELRSIAHSIDDARRAAATLNPRVKPLRNSDEMVARFAATESV